MKTKFLILAAATFLVTQCTCQQKSTEMKMPVTSSQEVNSTYPTEKPESGVTRLIEKQNIFLEKEKVKEKGQIIVPFFPPIFNQKWESFAVLK